MTETGGPAWRQTIFFPFADFSNLGRGTVLSCDVDSPTYSASYYDPRGTTDLHFPMPAVPYLKAAAVHRRDDGIADAVPAEPQPRRGDAGRNRRRRLRDLSVVEATMLADADLDAANTKDAPERISPVRRDLRTGNGKLEGELEAGFVEHDPADFPMIGRSKSQGAGNGPSG